MITLKQTFRMTTLPVRSLAHGLHLLVPHNKRFSEAIISIVLMLVGAYLATVHQEVIPRFLWDCAAWIIHAVGAAPVIGWAITFLFSE